MGSSRVCCQTAYRSVWLFLQGSPACPSTQTAKRKTCAAVYSVCVTTLHRCGVERVCCECRPTAFPAQHLRPSGVLSFWPDGLERTPGFYPGSNEQHRLFRRLLKTYLFARYYSASSSLGVLNDYALYKSTHSLTLLTSRQAGR